MALLPAGDVVKMQGQGVEWRLRVGTWRVRFFMDPSQRAVFVTTILPRGSAYKALGEV
jgi:mRNA-degrading endonuclease RelE of RelBE toxin-antitoxin system